MLIGLPLVIAAAVFAVSNRTTAPVDLWPFGVTIEAPVFLLVLGALGSGLLLGGLMVWLRAIGWRLSAASRAKRIAQLEQDLASLRTGPPNQQVLPPTTTAVAAR
jgi:uncharacterized integral membrane protein